MSLSSFTDASGPPHACDRVNVVRDLKEIVLARPRGFCAGVERAIDIVELALQVRPPPVYVRKEIVHNRHVVEALRAKGAIFIDELDEVPDGCTVIFSAHGVSLAVREEAKRRELRVIDATCPLVTKVHMEAARYARDGCTIVLIGHQDHDEVIGTVGQAPEKIVVVSSPDDVRTLQVPDAKRVAYVTQTTLAVDETQEIIEVLRQRFPHIVGPPKDDICYASQNRQAAVRAVAVQVDLVLVIGATNSSNANRLQEVSEASGTRAYLINDIKRIKPEWFDGVSRVGITAGASTPEFLVDEAIRVLREMGTVKVREVYVAEENIHLGLPQEIGICSEGFHLTKNSKRAPLIPVIS